MKIKSTKFQGLKIIISHSFRDSRGFFREDFKKKFFKNKNFIFSCTSSSKKNVRFIKFVYHIKYNKINKTIIEYMVLPDNYTKYNKIYDVGFRNFYYYQYEYN